MVPATRIPRPRKQSSGGAGTPLQNDRVEPVAKQEGALVHHWAEEAASKTSTSSLCTSTDSSSDETEIDSGPTSLPPRVRGSVRGYVRLYIRALAVRDGTVLEEQPLAHIRWWGEHGKGVLLAPHILRTGYYASDNSGSTVGNAAAEFPHTIHFPARASKEALRAYLRDQKVLRIALVSQASHNVIGRVEVPLEELLLGSDIDCTVDIVNLAGVKMGSLSCEIELSFLSGRIFSKSGPVKASTYAEDFSFLQNEANSRAQGNAMRDGDGDRGGEERAEQASSREKDAESSMPGTTSDSTRKVRASDATKKSHGQENRQHVKSGTIRKQKYDSPKDVKGGALHARGFQLSLEARNSASTRQVDQKWNKRSASQGEPKGQLGGSSSVLLRAQSKGTMHVEYHSEDEGKESSSEKRMLAEEVDGRNTATEHEQQHLVLPEESDAGPVESTLQVDPWNVSEQEGNERQPTDKDSTVRITLKEKYVYRIDQLIQRAKGLRSKMGGVVPPSNVRMGHNGGGYAQDERGNLGASTLSCESVLNDLFFEEIAMRQDPSRESQSGRDLDGGSRVEISPSATASDADDGADQAFPARAAHKSSQLSHFVNASPKTNVSVQVSDRQPADIDRRDRIEYTETLQCKVAGVHVAAAFAEREPHWTGTIRFTSNGRSVSFPVSLAKPDETSEGIRQFKSGHMNLNASFHISTNGSRALGIELWENYRERKLAGVGIVPLDNERQGKSDARQAQSQSDMQVERFQTQVDIPIADAITDEKIAFVSMSITFRNEKDPSVDSSLYRLPHASGPGCAHGTIESSAPIVSDAVDHTAVADAHDHTSVVKTHSTEQNAELVPVHQEPAVLLRSSGGDCNTVKLSDGEGHSHRNDVPSTTAENNASGRNAQQRAASAVLLPHESNPKPPTGDFTSSLEQVCESPHHSSGSTRSPRGRVEETGRSPELNSPSEEERDDSRSLMSNHSSLQSTERDTGPTMHESLPIVPLQERVAREKKDGGNGWHSKTMPLDVWSGQHAPDPNRVPFCLSIIQALYLPVADKVQSDDMVVSHLQVLGLSFSSKPVPRTSPVWNMRTYLAVHHDDLFQFLQTSIRITVHLLPMTSTGESAGDIQLGIAEVDISALAAGLEEVTGWYHLHPSPTLQATVTSVLQVSVRPLCSLPERCYFTLAEVHRRLAESQDELWNHHARADPSHGKVDQEDRKSTAALEAGDSSMLDSRESAAGAGTEAADNHLNVLDTRVVEYWNKVDEQALLTESDSQLHVLLRQNLEDLSLLLQTACCHDAGLASSQGSKPAPMKSEQANNIQTGLHWETRTEEGQRTGEAKCTSSQILHTLPFVTDVVDDTNSKESRNGGAATDGTSSDGAASPSAATSALPSLVDKSPKAPRSRTLCDIAPSLTNHSTAMVDEAHTNNCNQFTDHREQALHDTDTEDARSQRRLAMSWSDGEEFTCASGDVAPGELSWSSLVTSFTEHHQHTHKHQSVVPRLAQKLVDEIFAEVLPAEDDSRVARLEFRLRRVGDKETARMLRIMRTRWTSHDVT